MNGITCEEYLKLKKGKGKGGGQKPSADQYIKGGKH